MAKPSKLEPFLDLIRAERRRGTTYRRIAELLAEKGVIVDYSTIHDFVKVRSKPQRKVITMWEPENVSASPAAEKIGKKNTADHAGTSETAAANRDEQLDAIRRLKTAKPISRHSDKGLPNFNADAPLERLSDDEARRFREKL